MAGRPNTKWLKTMTRKLGSREAVRAEMARLGAAGGKKGTTGGFAANRELARIAGRKGGLKSRRRKSMATDLETLIAQEAQAQA